MRDYSVYDLLLDAVIVIDRGGLVQYCNDAFATLIDLPVKRIKTGQPIEKYIQCEPALFPDVSDLENMTEAQKYREIKFQSKTVEEGLVLTTLVPIDEKSDGSIVIYMRDMTLEEKLQNKYREQLRKKEEVIEQLKIAHAALEDYSKNLELKVKERTAELREVNKSLDAMINSLGQGFLIFRKDGLCEDVTSKATEDLLENSPQGQLIWDLLKITEQDLEEFKNWCSMLFDEPLPFDDLVPLGPRKYKHGEGLQINLEYHPERNEKDVVERVVLVATDKTEEIRATELARREEARAKMIVKMSQNKSQFGYLVYETRNSLKELQGYIAKEDLTDGELETVARIAHTLKGNLNLFAISIVAQRIHEFEDLVIEVSNRARSFDETRDNLKQKLNMVVQSFEQCLDETKEILDFAVDRDEQKRDFTIKSAESFLEKIQDNDKLTKDFRYLFILDPLESLFHLYEDLTQRLCQGQGKQVGAFKYQCNKLRVDAERFKSLTASLVHVFRNIIDHGLEIPEKRKRIGKSEAGTILIQGELIQKDGDDYLQIVIADDGAGIDPEVIRKKLVQQGKEAEAQKDDDEVLQYILDAGFSTKESVSQLSGRGVGLNAVAYEVEQLGGEIRVLSEIGKGTKIVMEIPEEN
jgi:two-component system chemotaxis sensor kinase CheA